MESWRCISHVAEADVFNKCRVDLGLGNDLLQQLDKNAIKRRVLEATLVCLCERRAHGERNNDIVGVLGGAKPLLAFVH